MLYPTTLKIFFSYLAIQFNIFNFLPGFFECVSSWFCLLFTWRQQEALKILKCHSAVVTFFFVFSRNRSEPSALCNTTEKILLWCGIQNKKLQRCEIQRKKNVCIVGYNRRKFVRPPETVSHHIPLLYPTTEENLFSVSALKIIKYLTMGQNLTVRSLPEVNSFKR